MWIITILIIIGGLSYIYSHCDKEEEYLVFKLIGYSFLGAFLFRFNDFPIPFGFLIFLTFFKPMVNKVAKTRAAYLGLLVLFIGIISPIVSQYYFERPIEIVASSNNLYLLDIKHDSEKIQEAIEHPKNLKIEDFRVNYEKDGEIRELRYSLVGYLEDNLILYNVNFLPEEQVYSVTSKKIDQWSQYERLVLADRFFESLEDINLKEVVEKENLEWYVIEGRGEYKTSAVTDSINFLVKDNKITRIYNSELPISGFNISLYGMLKIEETSSSVLYEGSKYVNYWFQE